MAARCGTFIAMKSFIHVLVVCVLASWAVAQQPQPGSGGGEGKGPRTRVIHPNPKAVEKIHDIITSMEKAWNAGDIAGRGGRSYDPKPKKIMPRRRAISSSIAKSRVA